MRYSFLNLDESTRAVMLEEYQVDLELGTLYKSKAMNDLGLTKYPELFIVAIQSGNEQTLAASLPWQFFLPTNSRGAKTMKNIHEVVACNDFNRYYMRAMIVRALKEDFDIEIYRAKASIEQRIRSVYAIGTVIKDANQKQEILKMLRNPENCFALAERILFQPNSGLSLKLVPQQKQTA